MTNAPSQAVAQGQLCAVPHRFARTASLPFGAYGSEFTMLGERNVGS
jgi:hypothetical protein